MRSSRLTRSASRRGVVVKLLRIVAAIGLAIAAAAVAFGQTDGASGRGRIVLTAAIEGVVGPATAHHVAEAIEEAEARGAQALVLRMNTPGGLSSSTRDIIADILASPVPVIGYVAPAGGHAASAGTYILYATHVAAMAPGTNIGAATPVQIGGDGLPGLPPDDPPDARPDDGGEAENGEDAGEEAEDRPEAAPEPADAMSRKAINDAVAQIRGLAELRGRNAEWAERAVREAATATAREALELGVVEIVADDMDALLDELDGRTVTIGRTDITLETAGAAVEGLEPSFITKALGVLANPNVALILMLIGVYGLIFELANPGTIGPGVIGAIALVLGLYALNQLPLNYAGLALILLGVAFLAAEALTPTSGVLGIGGVIAFLIGAAMLIDTDIPEFQLSWTVVGVAAGLSALLIVVVLGSVWRSHRRPPVAGIEQLLSQPAEVLDWEGRSGYVWAAGERWKARADQPLRPGQSVRVTRVHNLELTVAPKD